MSIILNTLDFLLNPIGKYLINKNRIRRKIAADILISSEQIEIEVHPPMKIKKNFQAILLEIEGCWQSLIDKKSGLRLANGMIINPQVEITDEFGNKYTLKSGMSFGEPDDNCEKFLISEIGFRGKLPEDRNYTMIRIVSDSPFLCNTVSWYDYNMK